MVTAKLIYVFVFAYEKCWFSHDAANFSNTQVLIQSDRLKLHAAFFLIWKLEPTIIAAKTKVKRLDAQAEQHLYCLYLPNAGLLIKKLIYHRASFRDNEFDMDLQLQMPKQIL